LSKVYYTFLFLFFFSINIKTESPGFQFIGGNGPYTIFEGIHLATSSILNQDSIPQL